MDLITVKVFHESIEAHLFKSKLESEGVTCFLFDENTVNVQPWASLAFGGIKLKVRESDREKVIEILKEMEENEG